MPVYNQSRSRVIQLIFIAVFIVIIGQLLHLQLFSSEYKIQAENNAIYRKVVYPDRGIIYDRKKKAILENTVMYDLIVTPSESKGTDTAFIVFSCTMMKEVSMKLSTVAFAATCLLFASASGGFAQDNNTNNQYTDTFVYACSHCNQYVW